MITFYNQNGETVAVRKKDDKGVEKFGVFVGTTPIDDAPLSMSELSMNEKIVELAIENEWAPCVVADKIGDKAVPTFQGEVQKNTAYKRLSTKEVCEKAKLFVTLQKEIKLLEIELKEELKNLKEDYAAQINEKEEWQKNLEPILDLGLEEIPCEASWERDPENELMVLVRRDTEKPIFIKYREMTPEEKQKNDLFDSSANEETPEIPEEGNPPTEQDFQEDEEQVIDVEPETEQDQEIS